MNSESPFFFRLRFFVDSYSLLHSYRQNVVVTRHFSVDLHNVNINKCAQRSAVLRSVPPYLRSCCSAVPRSTARSVNAALISLNSDKSQERANVNVYLSG